MSDAIEVNRDGPVQVLRINRPEKKNALTGAMYATLSDAIIAGDASADVRVHALLGSPGIFSAGNDLSDFLATAQGSGSLGGDVLRFISLLPRIQKPLIAGVDGKAVGIGTTLLFHCDLVYATPASEFSTPFLDLGLLPEAGSSLLMPRVMGHARAFEMLALGERYSANQALQSGIINAVVGADDLETRVMDSAKRLAAKPPEALHLARELMKGNAADISTRIEDEARLFEKRLASAEALEAFQAFFEKRAPNFSKARS